MRDVKVGDVVHVRMMVMCNRQDGAHFSGRDGEGDIRNFVPLADIVHVETRPLRVGDKVTWGYRSLIGKIKVIGRGDACVQVVSTRDGLPCSQDGHLVHSPLAQLDRV